jgi:Dolichyl-phosphate-mannose-protein mannosyltransferase
MLKRKAVVSLSVALLAAYLTIVLLEARARPPFCDEGWLASPGLNLLRHGSLETSVIEPAGNWLKDINRYTYWVMPLWLLGLAVWYHVFGFGLFVMRSFSAFWGIVGLVAVFSMARGLLGRQSVALLTATILAFDVQWLANSGTGRMDTMAAALVYAAFAVYLFLRKTSFRSALFWSNALLCAAMLTHLNAVIGLPALLLLVWTYDRSSLCGKNLALSAVPYLIGFGLFGIYAAQDQSAFVAQFTGNAKGHERLLVLHAPLEALRREIMVRYLDAYGWSRGGMRRFRLLTLATYLFGCLSPLLLPSLRGSRNVRTLCRMLALVAFGLFLIDGVKRQFYLVYVLPSFAILTATALDVYLRRPGVSRWISSAVAVLLIATGVAGPIFVVRDDQYRRSWLPLISFLRAHMNQRTVVMGPSELGFDLGYAPPLIDDFRLGYYSGLRPAFVVTDPDYLSLMHDLGSDDKRAFNFVRTEFSVNYVPVFTSGIYVVYAPKKTADGIR